MADGSMELEGGQLVMNGPLAAEIQQRRALLDRAVTILRHRRQEDLARLALALVELDLRDVMSVLNDEVRGAAGEFSGDPALLDAFRHYIRADLLSIQTDNFSEHDFSLAIVRIVLDAAVHAICLLFDNGGSYRGGGFGAVPASAAAVRVRSLEKQTFLRSGGNESVTEGGCGITECSICLDEFVDGEQVSVMPCPSQGHRFHPDCIVKWLGISNTCPLCRHVLPAY